VNTLCWVKAYAESEAVSLWGFDRGDSHTDF